MEWFSWGLLGLFLFTGLYCSLECRFFPLRHCGVWLRATVGSLPKRDRSTGVSSVQALAAALASTIGTGSIAGVAAAIWLGGPGAVFWMWVCALLGMSTSLVEKTLSVRRHVPAPGGGWQGGPMFYLKNRVLAVWFALACIPATLSGGNLVQSASISAALQGLFGWDPLPVGLVTALLAGFIMAGGFRRVAGAASVLVPVMAALYLGGGGLILFLRASEIPAALALIFRDALSPRAMVYGVARGIFTNEAGLGTSAMAHGAAQTDHPARQGMWGIFEVCVSTLLVCSVTALAILLTGAPDTAAAFGSVLGPGGRGIVSLSLVLFAFSSILGWSCYGSQALRFLFRRDVPAYRAVFLGCIVLGAVADASQVWRLVDLCNALLALPNLLGLLVLAPEAVHLLEAFISSPWKNNPG